MGNLVKYGEWDVADAAKAVEDAKSGGGGEFFKFEDGRNILRFLPPRVGERANVRIFQHFVKGGEKKTTTVVCPRLSSSNGGSCPICEHADALRRTGNAADKERAYEMSAKMRAFSNVIDRKNPDKGPQIAGFGKTVLEALAALRTDVDAGGNFTDPETGFDIIIEKTGQKMETKYAVRPARNQSPLGYMEWIEQQANLEQFATLKSRKEILELLGLDDVVDVQPVAPRAAAPKPVGKPAAVTVRRTAQDDLEEEAQLVD